MADVGNVDGGHRPDEVGLGRLNSEHLATCDAADRDVRTTAASDEIGMCINPCA